MTQPTINQEIILELVKQVTAAQVLLEKQGQTLEKIEKSLEKVDSKVDADIKELEKFQHRGAGLLIGLGIFATTTATMFADGFAKVKHFIFG